MEFLDWLRTQSERSDRIGTYARSSIRNIRYPRTSRLCTLLKYEPTETRDLLKAAHREYRKVRVKR